VIYSHLVLKQGTLTEGEGTVLLTSTLSFLVFVKKKILSPLSKAADLKK
jgi:hypothetical protein